MLVKSSNIIITLYKTFVDDANKNAVLINFNLHWDSQTRRLVKAESSSVSPDEHTATTAQQIANSVTSMFRFTSDFPSKHDNGRMPATSVCCICYLISCYR